MNAIPFFDCNCTIGITGYREPETLYKTEDILRELEYHDIRGAVVHHALAVEFNQAYGNKQLSKELKKSARVAGAWVVLPHHAGEMPEPRRLVGMMKRRGVAVARMLPKSHGFDTTEHVCGRLFSELASARIPLFVDISEIGFGELRRICLAHPDLAVVVTGISWGSDRNLYPVMEECRNLHVETSKYQGHEALKHLCERFGPERILFGTGLPHMSPGAAKAMVMYADVPLKVKKMIAGGNLMRLIGRRMPPAYRARRGAGMDAIARRVDAGRPLNFKVIDAHAHIGHEGCMGIAKCSLHEQDAPALLRSMKSYGARAAFISSWIGITSDFKAGNALIARLLKKYPGKFIGYATFNPSYPDEIEAELKRCFTRYGMKGIKPYPPRHNYPLDGPNNRKVLEFADIHRLPILCHYGGNPNSSITAAQVEKLSEKYPRAKFIFAHAGSSWAAVKKCTAVAKKRKNVFLEITYTSVTFGAIEYMAREAGSDRVIFGTDFPMRDPHPQMAWVAYAKLPLADKTKIFGGNIERILKDVRL